MKTIKDAKVGDVVWWKDDANGRHRAPVQTTITSIGSKLVKAGGLTFRKDSLRENDVYQHRFLIIDLQDYAQNVEKIQLINKINYGHFNLSGKTLDEVKHIAELLGLKK